MNQARVAEALQTFRRAAAQDPSLFAARLNEGIALLNSQQLGEARDVLLDATRRQPQSARAWYNLGIAYRTLAQNAAAVDAFEQVARIDPGDADTMYFLGQLHLQAQRYDQAIAAFEKCLALDSLHLSAEFGLSRAYLLSGNDAAAAQHLTRFDQLTESKIGKQISLTYGEQGIYSTAEPAGAAEAAPAGFSSSFHRRPIVVGKFWRAASGKRHAGSLRAACGRRGMFHRLRCRRQARPAVAGAGFHSLSQYGRRVLGCDRGGGPRPQLAARTDVRSAITTMTAATISFWVFRRNCRLPQ